MWKGTKQCSYALWIVDYEGMISTLRPTTHGQWNESGMDMLPYILSDMIQLDIKIFKKYSCYTFPKISSKSYSVLQYGTSDETKE